MKYLILLAITASMFTWLACGNGRPAETLETTNPVSSSDSTNPSQFVPANPGSILPDNASMSGLNPEHGQPGHRCDIGVGQPLNSPPTSETHPAITTTPPTTTTTPPISISSDKPAVTPTLTPTITPTMTPTKVAPGMNPAHGEPGHRCDISVGAPLDSKPPEQPAAKITTPVIAPTNQPIKADVKTTTAPGMNPAHGEPGHRCDIGVGEPLNSPAATPSVVPQSPAKSQVIPPVIPIKTDPNKKKDN